MSSKGPVLCHQQWRAEPLDAACLHSWVDKPNKGLRDKLEHISPRPIATARMGGGLEFVFVVGLLWIEPGDQDVRVLTGNGPKGSM